MPAKPPTTFDAIRNFDALPHKALLEFIARRSVSEFGCLLLDFADDQAAKAPPVRPWVEPVWALINADSIVGAVKLLRTKPEEGGAGVTGLKDAVDACRMARDGFVAEGATPTEMALTYANSLRRAHNLPDVTKPEPVWARAARMAHLPEVTDEQAAKAEGQVWVVTDEEGDTVGVYDNVDAAHARAAMHYSAGAGVAYVCWHPVLRSA